MTRNRWFLIACGLLATLLTFVALAPLLSMLLSSLRASQFAPLLSGSASLRWYEELWGSTAIGASMLRGALTAIAAALISTLLGFLSAYRIARHTQRQWFALLLLTTPALLPSLAYGLALMQGASAVGIGHGLALVVAGHTAVLSPIATGVFYYRLKALDESSELAAYELGASSTRVVWQVVAGQVRGAWLAAFGIIAFLSWDEFVISWFAGGFDRTYPVQVWTMLESTLTPVIDAASVVASLTLAVVLIVLLLPTFRPASEERQ